MDIYFEKIKRKVLFILSNYCFRKQLNREIIIKIWTNKNLNLKRLAFKGLKKNKKSKKLKNIENILYINYFNKLLLLGFKGLFINKDNKSINNTTIKNFKKKIIFKNFKKVIECFKEEKNKIIKFKWKIAFLKVQKWIKFIKIKKLINQKNSYKFKTTAFESLKMYKYIKDKNRDKKIKSIKFNMLYNMRKSFFILKNQKLINKKIIKIRDYNVLNFKNQKNYKLLKNSFNILLLEVNNKNRIINLEIKKFRTKIIWKNWWHYNIKNLLKIKEYIENKRFKAKNLIFKHLYQYFINSQNCRINYSLISINNETYNKKKYYNIWFNKLIIKINTIKNYDYCLNYYKKYLLNKFFNILKIKIINKNKAKIFRKSKLLRCLNYLWNKKNKLFRNYFLIKKTRIYKILNNVIYTFKMNVIKANKIKILKIKFKINKKKLLFKYLKNNMKIKKNNRKIIINFQHKIFWRKYFSWLIKNKITNKYANKLVLKRKKFIFKLFKNLLKDNVTYNLEKINKISNKTNFNFLKNSFKNLFFYSKKSIALKNFIINLETKKKINIFNFFKKFKESNVEINWTIILKFNNNKNKKLKKKILFTFLYNLRINRKILKFKKNKIFKIKKLIFESFNYLIKYNRIKQYNYNIANKVYHENLKKEFMRLYILKGNQNLQIIKEKNLIKKVNLENRIKFLQNKYYKIWKKNTNFKTKPILYKHKKLEIRYNKKRSEVLEILNSINTKNYRKPLTINNSYNNSNNNINNNNDINNNNINKPENINNIKPKIESKNINELIEEFEYKSKYYKTITNISEKFMIENELKNIYNNINKLRN